MLLIGLQGGGFSQPLGVVCDVSDEEQVASLVECAVESFGRLDFAFNNAGIQAPPTKLRRVAGSSPVGRPFAGRA